VRDKGLSRGTLTGILLCSALAWLVVRPTICRAQTAALPVELRVHSGATCLDVDALRDELAVHMEGVIVPAGVTVEVNGSDDDPHTVTTRVRYADGSVAERLFSPAPTFCPYLHQAVALTLALALKAADPRPAQAPTTPAGTPLTPLDEPTGQAPEQDAAPVPAAPAAGGELRAYDLAVGFGPELEVAAVGRAAFGGSLAAIVAFPYVRVRVEPSYLRAPSTELAGFGSYHIAWLALRAGVCGALPVGTPALQAELCIAGEVGRARVHHAGLTGSGDTSRVLVGFCPGVALAWNARTNLTLRLAASLHHVYRPLQIAVSDQNGKRLAEENLGRIGGLFSMTLAFRVPFGSKRH
jgi:hypothetical protein